MVRCVQPFRPGIQCAGHQQCAEEGVDRHARSAPRKAGQPTQHGQGRRPQQQQHQAVDRQQMASRQQVCDAAIVGCHAPDRPQHQQQGQRRRHHGDLHRGAGLPGQQQAALQRQQRHQRLQAAHAGAWWVELAQEMPVKPDRHRLGQREQPGGDGVEQRGGQPVRQIDPVDAEEGEDEQRGNGLLDEVRADHALSGPPPGPATPCQRQQHKGAKGPQHQPLVIVLLLGHVPRQRLDVQPVVAGGAQPQQQLGRGRGRSNHQVVVERAVGRKPPVMAVARDLRRLARPPRVEQGDLVELAGLDAQHQWAWLAAAVVCRHQRQPHPGGAAGVAQPQPAGVRRPGHLLHLVRAELTRGVGQPGACADGLLPGRASLRQRGRQPGCWQPDQADQADQPRPWPARQAGSWVLATGPMAGHQGGGSAERAGGAPRPACIGNRESGAIDIFGNFLNSVRN